MFAETMDHIFQPFVQGKIEICSGEYLPLQPGHQNYPHPLGDWEHTTYLMCPNIETWNPSNRFEDGVCTP